jgi:hypothetical protein
MDRERISLKEYETCQSEVNNRGNQFWISLSIIISINLLLLAQTVYNIIQGSSPIRGYASLLVVSILAVVMIITNLIFKKWQDRQHYVTNVIYQKMRKLEDIFEMNRNWLIYGLDLKGDPSKRREWQKLPESRKVFIDRLIASYPYLPKYRRPYGDRTFGYILNMLIITWFVQIALMFLIYFFPAARAWLYN